MGARAAVAGGRVCSSSSARAAARIARASASPWSRARPRRLAVRVVVGAVADGPRSSARGLRAGRGPRADRALREEIARRYARGHRGLDDLRGSAAYRRRDDARPGAPCARGGGMNDARDRGHALRLDVERPACCTPRSCARAAPARDHRCRAPRRVAEAAPVYAGRRSPVRAATAASSATRTCSRRRAAPRRRAGGRGGGADEPPPAPGPRSSRSSTRICRR